MIRETSRNAYHSLDLNESEKKVMAFMHSLPNGTALNRRQISQRSNIPINCIAGRVNELVAKGYLEELEPERDPVTGKSAHPVRIKPAQMALFSESERRAA